MKTISLAVMALLSTAQAVNLSNDNEGGWVNPIYARDDGLDDDTVVTQLDSQINMERKNKQRDEYDHDENTVSPYDAAQQHQYLDKYDKVFGNEDAANFEGVQIGTLMASIKKNMDNYDGDSNTVSPYDAMKQHKYLPKYDEDFGKPYANFEGVQIGTLMKEIRSRKAPSRDAYDDDPTTVSPYDAEEQNPYLDKYSKDVTGLAQKKKPDAYDGDKDTVSVYDGMTKHEYVDKYAKDYGVENDLAQKN